MIGKWNVKKKQKKQKQNQSKGRMEGVAYEIRNA